MKFFDKSSNIKIEEQQQEPFDWSGISVLVKSPYEILPFHPYHYVLDLNDHFTQVLAQTISLLLSAKVVRYITSFTDLKFVLV